MVQYAQATNDSTFGNKISIFCSNTDTKNEKFQFIQSSIVQVKYKLGLKTLPNLTYLHSDSCVNVSKIQTFRYCLK
uniref:Uncharacterized protein n=1 Tax=Ciona savignyi TaxID=51511 RepID=H2Z872_CIOSA